MLRIMLTVPGCSGLRSGKELRIHLLNRTKVSVCLLYRMECPSRSTHKYLLLQVWCGLLTVAMVVMAALLTSIKPKSTEVSVSAMRGQLKKLHDT